ncbi:MAG: MBL fold metallo-hydrolase [Nitrososphaeria archaeon]
MSGVRARALPGGGLLVEVNGRRIALDPREEVRADITFVSHAHADHLPRASPESEVIATQETARLADVRGIRLRRVRDGKGGLELVNTGHILGSAGLLIDGVIYYTGDISGRPRGFMPGPGPVRCGTLITESTYGRPEYRFPPHPELVGELQRFLAEQYNEGRPALLVGYPLGKSQLLQHLIRGWRPLVSFESVEAYSRVYREFGVELPEPDALVRRPEDLLGLRGPAVVLAPSSQLGALLRVAERVGAGVAWFSGWAVRRRLPGARGFALSDHADYGELLGFAASTGAEEVLTVHGFPEDLARSLVRMGINARPLSESAGLYDFAPG